MDLVYFFVFVAPATSGGLAVVATLTAKNAPRWRSAFVNS